jgi:putative hydrolase of the HAD superfamily
MIKHISFDFWQTLFHSNPIFRKKRAEFIKTYFNLGMSVSEIEQLIIEQDKIFDKRNEIEDTKLPALDMFQNIVDSLNCLTKKLQQDTEKLLEMSNQLFLENPPELLNEQIPNILEELVSSGITLSIGSNTGFVEGKILRQLLQSLGILKHFSFCIFSDEIKSSKPSARFFNAILEKTNLPKSQILHIGDNPAADAAGAESFGFKHLLITNQNYTIDDIRAKL